MGFIFLILFVALIMFINISIIRNGFSKIKKIITKEKFEFDNIDEAPISTFILDELIAWCYSRFVPMNTPVKIDVYQNFIIASYEGKYEKFEYKPDEIEIEEVFFNHYITLMKNGKSVRFSTDSTSNYNLIKKYINEANQ